MLRSLLLAALWSISLSLIAQPAPWSLWQSKVDGRLHCAQTTPGEGWTRHAGPFKDAHCRIPKHDASVPALIGSTDGSTEPAALQKDELIPQAATRGVSMTCRTAGSAVQIRASNSGTVTSSCTAQCSYRTKQGLAGVLQCSGSVPVQSSDVLFCQRTSSTESPYTLADPPGSFTCR